MLPTRYSICENASLYIKTHMISYAYTEKGKNLFIKTAYTLITHV